MQIKLGQRIYKIKETDSMKKKVWYLSIICVAFICCVNVYCKNLITDEPGFEKKGYYWFSINKRLENKIVEGGGIDNSAAACIEVADAKMTKVAGWRKKGFIPVKGGEIYTFRAMVKGTVSKGSCYALIRFWSGCDGVRQVKGKSKICGSTTSVKIDKSTDNKWIMLSHTFTVPKEANGIHIELATKNFLGQIFFDDISVTEQNAIVENKASEYVILLAHGASIQEKFAAAELSRYLKKSTGTIFPIVNSANFKKQAVIAVGNQAALLVMPELKTDNLGEEGLIIKSNSTHLVLTGGQKAPRGTIYAVYTYLEDIVGFRWWSPGETYTPKLKHFAIPTLNIKYRPIFAFRNTSGKPALNQSWSARNKLNGAVAKLDLKHGGYADYVRSYGNTWLYVHTFYRIVPPKKYFSAYPEWFSEINGKRTHNRAQLCLTNKSLQAFMIKKVKEYLQGLPPDSIISISQNDWAGRCQCEKCLAIEKREGSPSGPVIDFVNTIADGIKKEFPKALISTLAYTYTQKPPTHLKPRSNVIIRLCSIKSSFAHTFTDPVNAEFYHDLKEWKKITSKLFVWDYVTGFHQYLMPFPNLRVIGPNIRFFADNSVVGVKEQGNSRTFGGEFTELRTWIIAKLLWKPQLDDQELIWEFTSGYYGAAAPFIDKYIKLIHDEAEATDVYLSCYTWVQNPYLNTKTLVKSEKLFTQAESAVVDSPRDLKRVRRARLPVIYSILNRYSIMRQQVDFFRKGKDFKLKPFAWYLEQFKTLCKENNVTTLRERTTKPVLFHDVMKKRYRPIVKTPNICKGISRTDWILAQDDVLLQFKPKKAQVVADLLASNGLAVQLQPNNKGWSVKSHVPHYADMKSGKSDKWSIYIAARVISKGKKEGMAFTCGLYDVRNKKVILSKSISVKQTSGTEYKLYKLGEASLNPHGYVWVAPTINANNVKNILIDYVMYIKEKK
jgi:uncharacterized protein DUF4838/glycosyl hydrolase family 67